MINTVINFVSDSPLMSNTYHKATAFSATMKVFKQGRMGNYTFWKTVSSSSVLIHFRGIMSGFYLLFGISNGYAKLI